MIPIECPRFLPTSRLTLLALCVSAFAWFPLTALSSTWKAGVATEEITPKEPTWMTGYGSRNRPNDVSLHPLWVKALALEDPHGTKSVLLTADLCGITAAITNAVATELNRSHGLPRSAVLVNVSHTHSGPYVEGYAPALADIPYQDWGVIIRYRQDLERAMFRVARRALDHLAPATLSWGQDSADFGVNRRNNRPEDQVPARRAAGELQGPIDHDVPVLRVQTAPGEPRAVVFGYACHNTVTGEYLWNGDYAGFAQAAVEARHPGATAFYFIGCGGDINPLPRRTIELARQYGNQLADAVDRALAGRMQTIEGSLGTAYAVADLPFESTFSRQQLEAQLADAKSNVYTRQRARHLIRQLEQTGKVASSHPYPIQVWKLGRDLTWVALAGEVVVDYSLRLKRELGSGTWVAGYSNDVMAYIPSERVLQEGGYEGDTSMLAYGQPSRWAAGLEETIVSTVKKLVDQLR